MTAVQSKTPANTAESILDQLGAAVLVVDRQGGTVYRNALAVNWLPDAATLTGAFADARFLEPFDGWSAELTQVLRTGVGRRFCGVIRPQGSASTVSVSLHCSPLLDEKTRRPTGAVLLVQQGIEQEAVVEQLEVSNRLAALGKLAARVAHELNNPLDGILRYVNLALRLVGDTPESKLKTYLGESRTGLMRMVQIIGDLLEYSRTSDGAFDALGVNEIIEQAVKSHAAAAEGNGVVTAVDFQSHNMPRVSGSRLYQVCSNLIRNAIDAMPNGGRLSITSGLVQDEVVIRVSDTGMGLPEPIEKIFEPFYTTKPPGQGTGLGLTICKDFVEDMKGRLTATPGENGGATFTVRIPLAGFQRQSPSTSPPRRAADAVIPPRR